MGDAGGVRDVSGYMDRLRWQDMYCESFGPLMLNDAERSSQWSPGIVPDTKC